MSSYSDHDPITMQAISDASGGTFSFIESYEMVEDAFASCIGGLLSVVTQALEVGIKSIPSASEISNQGSQGLVNIGDLYKEFLEDQHLEQQHRHHIRLPISTIWFSSLNNKDPKNQYSFSNFFIWIWISISILSLFFQSHLLFLVLPMQFLSTYYFK